MIYGYIRVSTDKQSVENQRFEINKFIKKTNCKVDEWIEETVSGTVSPKKRNLGKLIEKAKEGDTIICSEISRLGRNMFMIMSVLNVLMERGVKIGADIPYCLMRGTALAEGIGEVLTPLPDMMRCPVLIAKPAISVSTKYVYEHLDALENPQHPDIDAMMEDIKNQDLYALGSHMGNILEGVTIEKYPVIQQIKDVMKENGAVVSMMSGSGPTVFGIYKTRGAAKEGARKIKSRGLARQVYVTNVHNVRRKP